MAFGGETQDTGGQGEHGVGQRSRGLGLRARSWLPATWLLAGFFLTSGAAEICSLVRSIKTMAPHKCPGSSTHCRRAPGLSPQPPAPGWVAGLWLHWASGLALPSRSLPRAFPGLPKGVALSTLAALLLPGSLLLGAMGHLVLNNHTPGTQGPQPGTGLASRALTWKAKSWEALQLPPTSIYFICIDKV